MRLKGSLLTRIDFIPIEHHEAGRRRRMIRLRSGGIGALVVVMCLWFGVNRQMIASARAIMPEIETLQKQIDIHRSRTEKLMADRATLDARRAFLEQLHQQISLVPVLADISDRMPESVLLTRMSFNPGLLGDEGDESRSLEAQLDPRAAKPDVPKTETPKPAHSANSAESSTTISGPAITIRGVARTVPDILEFAESLERSKLLNRVEMRIAEPGIWAGKEVQKFEVTCALTPQARRGK